jgi:high-affinity nickel-transport protein
VVGVVHGLSGSAAIALLVLTTIDSASRALLYLAVFGLGTLLGMMLLTLAMSVPLSALSRRVPNAEQRLARITGLVSIALGLFLAYRIGIVDGLLFGAPGWHLR